MEYETYSSKNVNPMNSNPTIAVVAEMFAAAAVDALAL
jgi:hypothetical protein